MYRMGMLIAGIMAALSAAPVRAAGKDALAASADRGRGHGCEHAAVRSADALVRCIRRNGLWSHMLAFQQIAEQNPGPDGHPSRNIGEPGYLASANYVAAQMAAAGYRVQLQQYTVPYFNYTRMAHFERVSPSAATFALRADWNPPTYSGSGNVTAPVEPVGGIQIPLPDAATSTSGCSADDFSGFTAGHIALIQRGTCGYYSKVRNAINAGAVGVIIFNDGGSGHTGSLYGSLSPDTPVSVPVAMASFAIGRDFVDQYQHDQAPVAHLDVQTIHDPHRADYNVIADSPYGDPNRVLVLEGHLDAIYGAGMLDSASGSATLLEVGRKLAHTPTPNHVRLVWFGGEELGLYGSQNYVYGLSEDEVGKIVFDMDADVTATPNYVTAIADPANSYYSDQFPAQVLTASQRGNDYFREYFQRHRLPYVDWSNDGTDSWMFSWRGVPNTGILTGQDCCKTQDLVDLFGGTLGNYEGNLGTSDGGFVDRPFLWGDNLDNNDPAVLEATSKAFAYVAWKLANDVALPTTAQLREQQAKAQVATSKRSKRQVPQRPDPVGADR